MAKDDHAFAETIASDTARTLADAEPPAASLTDRVVLAGRWRIASLLGSGGMGTVYRARDLELDEDVALKVVRAEIVSPTDLERFRREVKLSRRVTHRNVARVFELGEHQGMRFFTMELVEGESLRSRLDRGGRLEIGEVVTIGACVCRGLAAAHEVGVLHRDLKPDNVLVARDGRVAITDFGIASSLDASGRAGESSFVGTPHYMAPEQVDGSRPLDARTDVYALGVMLYELLTGSPPFTGATPLAVATARLLHPPPDPRSERPSIPAEIALLVRRCLARDPDERFGGAPQVEAALAGVSVSHPSVLPGRETSRPPTPKTPPVGARLVRMAVLPLEHLGPEERDYVAQGLTEDLIDSLSAFQGLRVAAHASVARFRSADARDARAIGKELGVEVVAEGSLRPMPGDLFRLTVRLIGVRDGIQLWASRFDVPASELLTINDQAAAAIADAVAIKAPPPERALTDPVAIDLYLRARARYREFWIEGAVHSAHLYAEAVERAPESPLLIAGHALALARLSFFTASSLGPAQEAAARALALAPDLGEAHLAAAAVALQLGRMPEAYDAAVVAVGKSPSLAEAHQMIGRILAETGPADAALRALGVAAELDPQSGLTLRERVRLLALLGRWDEAESLLEHAPGGEMLDRVGRLVMHMRLLLWRGDVAAIASRRKDLERIREELPGGFAFRRFMEELGKAIDESRAPEVDELLAAFSPDEGSARRALFFHQLAAEANGRFHSQDEAVSLIAKAVKLGLADLMWMDHCPALEPVRAHPGWAEVHAAVAARARVLHARVRG